MIYADNAHEILSYLKEHFSQLDVSHLFEKKKKKKVCHNASLIQVIILGLEFYKMNQ